MSIADAHSAGPPPGQPGPTFSNLGQPFPTTAFAFENHYKTKHFEPTAADDRRLRLRKTFENHYKTKHFEPTAADDRRLRLRKTPKPLLEMLENAYKTNEKTTSEAHGPPWAFPGHPGGPSCAPCAPKSSPETNGSRTYCCRSRIIAAFPATLAV